MICYLFGHKENWSKWMTAHCSYCGTLYSSDHYGLVEKYLLKIRMFLYKRGIL